MNYKINLGKFTPYFPQLSRDYSYNFSHGFQLLLSHIIVLNFGSKMYNYIWKLTIHKGPPLLPSSQRIWLLTIRLLIRFPTLSSWNFSKWIRSVSCFTWPHEDNWVTNWLRISGYDISSCWDLPVNLQILVDRCSSLGRSKPQIVIYLCEDIISFSSQ